MDEHGNLVRQEEPENYGHEVEREMAKMLGEESESSHDSMTFSSDKSKDKEKSHLEQKGKMSEDKRSADVHVLDSNRKEKALSEVEASSVVEKAACGDEAKSSSEVEKTVTEEIAKTGSEVKKAVTEDIAKSSSEVEKAVSEDIAKSSSEVEKAVTEDIAKSRSEIEKAVTEDIAKSSSEIEKAVTEDIAKSSSEIEKAVAEEITTSSSEVEKAASKEGAITYSEVEKATAEEEPDNSSDGAKPVIKGGGETVPSEVEDPDENIAKLLSGESADAKEIQIRGEKSDESSVDKLAQEVTDESMVTDTAEKESPLKDKAEVETITENKSKDFTLNIPEEEPLKTNNITEEPKQSTEIDSDILQAPEKTDALKTKDIVNILQESEESAVTESEEVLSELMDIETPEIGAADEDKSIPDEGISETEKTLGENEDGSIKGTAVYEQISPANSTDGNKRKKKPRKAGSHTSDEELLSPFSPEEQVFDISSDSDADPTWAPTAEAVEVSDANDTDPEEDKTDEEEVADLKSKASQKNKIFPTPIVPPEVSKILTPDTLQQILETIKLPLKGPVTFSIQGGAPIPVSSKKSAHHIAPRGKVPPPVLPRKKQNNDIVNSRLRGCRASRKVQISLEKSRKTEKLLGIRMFEGLGKIKRSFDFSTFLNDYEDELQFKKFCLIVRECLKDVCESKNAVTNIGKLTMYISRKKSPPIMPELEVKKMKEAKSLTTPVAEKEIQQEAVDEPEMLECMTVDSSVENHYEITPCVETAMEENVPA